MPWSTHGREPRGRWSRRPPGRGPGREPRGAVEDVPVPAVGVREVHVVAGPVPDLRVGVVDRDPDQPEPSGENDGAALSEPRRPGDEGNVRSRPTLRVPDRRSRVKTIRCPSGDQSKPTASAEQETLAGAVRPDDVDAVGERVADERSVRGPLRLAKLARRIYGRARYRLRVRSRRVAPVTSRSTCGSVAT